MKSQVSPAKYILLDANVVVAYYIPEATKGKQAKERGWNLIESCRKGAHPEWCLMIPNTVIAEVFATFAKYCFGTWNPHVRKNLPAGLDRRKYNRIRSSFHSHIHNGELFHQVELSRYHILGVDLIAPIDHNFQFYRGDRYKVPMQTFDMLTLSMGIELSHKFGSDRFLILTADNRMADICRKAGSGINRNTARRLGLIDVAEELNFDFSPSVYPRIMNLAKAKIGELANEFGEWPLQIPTRSRTGICSP